MENNDPVGGVAVPTEPTVPLKSQGNPARTGADRPIDPPSVSEARPAPDGAAGRWRWSITVDGEELAAGDAPDHETAEREGWHYLVQYAGEGVEVSLTVGPSPERGR